MAFNKLFVMLPVMLAARKIDGEDPNIVYWLRVAYATIQFCCTLVVIYTYIQASSVAGKGQGGLIYVAPPPVVSFPTNLTCLVVMFAATHQSEWTSSTDTFLSPHYRIYLPLF